MNHTLTGRDEGTLMKIVVERASDRVLGCHMVGADAPEAWLVEVPGGLVRVRVLPEGRVELAGPAELVATATVDLDALLDGDARV